MPVQFPHKRICIIGTSASGKTTLSRSLSSLLGVRHVELDALYHLPNWSHDDWSQFRERAVAALSHDGWVCDGNYFTRADQLRQAELIIWLNYPFRIVFTRVLRRTIVRLFTKEELWNGNREGWRQTFFFKREYHLVGSANLLETPQRYSAPAKYTPSAVDRLSPPARSGSMAFTIQWMRSSGTSLASLCGFTKSKSYASQTHSFDLHTSYFLRSSFRLLVIAEVHRWNHLYEDQSWQYRAGNSG
jgi:hypothetical protein